MQKKTLFLLIICSWFRLEICKAGEYLGLPDLRIIHSSQLFEKFKEYKGKRVTLLGYLPAQVQDVNIFRLLPGRDYEKLPHSSREMATILLLPKSDRVKKDTISCIGKMVELWGTVGTFSGMLSLNDVESVICKKE